MKKMILLLFTCFLGFLTACSAGVPEEESVVSVIETSTPEPTPIPEHILTVYFSRMETDGVDTVSAASRIANEDRLYGNVEYIANLIHEEVGGDIVQLETVSAYPETHAELLTYVQNEIDTDAYPELTTHFETLENYDTIFLGFPLWDQNIALPVITFLESYDVSNKTIYVFDSNAGDEFGHSLDTIKELQPDANVIEGIAVHRDQAAEADTIVHQWISIISY